MGYMNDESLMSRTNDMTATASCNAAQHRFALPLVDDHQETSMMGPNIRTEFGVARSSCGCNACRIFCKVMPGRLIPADLARLIPAIEDPLVWARVHLRAVPSGVLVPARTVRRGPCHWLLANDHCAVHADSPFGCAMFSCSLPPAESTPLQEAGTFAILDDHSRKGLYSIIWETLWEEGLRDYDCLEGKDRAARYISKLENNIHRKQAQANKKNARIQKKKSKRRS